MDNVKYTVSSTPHIRSNDSIEKIMGDVIIALAPAAIAGVYFFGVKAALLILISIASCVVFEGLYQKITKQTVTITDLSAVVTGLLIAMNIPAEAAWWIPVVGGFFAIVVAKQVFGGLGQNFINPALAARAFLVASYPSHMTGSAFKPTRLLLASGVDELTYATPLTEMKAAGAGFTANADNIIDGLIGNVGGTIGETCAVALIIGGIYLLARKVISWRIPVSFILTVFVFMLIAGGEPINAVYHIFIGGLMLGAFFMATDYASSPVTPNGQIIMGIGCGIITSVIRLWGGYPEGVSYSILLMNLAVPLIDRYTKPKIFGEVKKDGE